MFSQTTSPNNHLVSKFSDFENEDYNEYKRRVFAQLASEYEEDKTEQNKCTKHENGNRILHTSSANDSDSLHHSTIWNDVSANSVTSFSSNHTLPHQKNRTSLSCQHSSFHCDKASKSENDLYNDNSDKPLMNWSSYEEQIKLISEKMETKHSNHFNNPDFRCLTGRKMIGRKNHHQKQKIDREAIRHKLSLSYPEQRNDSNHYDSSVNRLERSFSSTSQSLQVCYINASCSSSDSESPPCTPSLTSPSFSPRVLRPLNHGRSSSSSSPYGSENTIISNHHHHRDRNKLEELELEARFQLARAHQQVKRKAREERSGREDGNSLIQKVLHGTLPEEISLKMKSYCLTDCDCGRMTLAQLRLIINDMNRQKFALNDELIALLIARNELRTLQDAKLVDVDDMKVMINSVGPETTV